MKNNFEHHQILWNNPNLNLRDLKALCPGKTRFKFADMFQLHKSIVPQKYINHKEYANLLAQNDLVLSRNQLQLHKIMISNIWNADLSL